MHTTQCLFLALLACVAACNADNANNRSIELSKAAVDNRAFVQYVPEGWILQDQRILDVDVDGDGTKDAILTLIEEEHLQKGDIPSQEDERAILVLLGDKNGKYRRSSFAKNVLLCASCAGLMGTGDIKEPDVIAYAGGVLNITWMAGSRDIAIVDINFGFDAKLRKFVLLSDRLEKRNRVEGTSTIRKRDFVRGIQSIDGNISKIDKKIVLIEAVKYFYYLK